ncbi:alpha/beta hydrolase [Streptomyces niveiscabiei]|uniref:alpha/beta fold hydrolase n=1 Tax=Streptomyces niveiscabiei TaxID=164115 RepID=UPI0029A43D69|nr:alpha/beta hydrolase [Streptomyces niveiscabiei]MDX3387020.1 alpha/beta hydrolase [Streptomyces niveiscabiei]
MTVVFVHGVPETAALWDRLRQRLGRESVAVGLPGFGTERPAGFGGGKDAHAEWLAARLRELPGPVDLVGHDWGALLTYRVATAYDVPLRSWAADVAGVLHPAYVWHEFARIWQTPGDGEAWFDNLRATPHDAPGSIAAVLRAQGVREDDARSLQEGIDEAMGQEILGLYRSATPNLYADWGPGLRETPAPGLVLHPAGDLYDDRDAGAEVARMLGARVRVLDGVGHQWPLQDPDQAVDVLRAFWDAVG